MPGAVLADNRHILAYNRTTRRTQDQGRTPMRTLILTLLMLGPIALPLDAANPNSAIEFMQRRDALKAGDATGHYKLGVWAEARGLQHQAALMYHRTLKLNPDHGDAYQRLVKIADTTRLPEDAALRKKLRDEFPDHALHASQHYVLLYDTDEKWARSRAALLEKAHDTFFATYRRMGFKPLPLKGRMVCVLFADHADFDAYARRVDKASLGWSAGYYSTGTNRIVFYDERTSPHFKQMLEKIAGLEAEADDLRAQITAASNARKHAIVFDLRAKLEDVDQQLRYHRNKHKNISKDGNTVKSTHEAVHQLAFNSGHQDPTVQYPFWFSEGLACNFEPASVAERFGPLHPNAFRRYQLATTLKTTDPVPLRELVRTHKPPADDLDRTVLMYNQAWVLYGFLFKFHRDELKAYVRHMNSRKPGTRTADQFEKDFIEAFGPIDKLEAKYKRHLDKLK